jgi:pyruvate/2-oxoglutarate dehydrogenase complex dihydrolipoamide dehydrogenase (E3) component
VTAAPEATRYDLVVIGGGSAGLTAARFAAQLGAKVLIAAERLGGDCTWTGCIPSKALIRAARLVHDARRAAAIGIGSGEVAVDFARMMAEVRGVIARVYFYETPEAMAKERVDVAIGAVRFVDGETVEAGDRRILGRHFVICTGAAPEIPSIRGLDGVPHLTYETVFDLDRLPASLIVVGAGATGVELAQAFARLGSKVTLIDECASVLPSADPEASALIQARLIAEGVDIHMPANMTEVTSSNRRVQVEAGTTRCEAAALLVATGRRPRVAGLDLEQAGVELVGGAVRVDKFLRTTNPRIYAAGDVTGAAQFTHYAGWQGFVAARNALLPGPQEGLRTSIPWAVFTDPEVAQAGLSEAEARTQFGDVKVHRLELDRVDRAQTEDERDGFLKLVSRSGGRLVGATAVSRAAGETINELALAIDKGLSVSDLASAIHVYPTFGFAVQQLAAEVSLEAAAAGVRGRVMRALRRLF